MGADFDKGLNLSFQISYFVVQKPVKAGHKTPVAANRDSLRELLVCIGYSKFLCVLFRSLWRFIL